MNEVQDPHYLEFQLRNNCFRMQVANPMSLNKIKTGSIVKDTKSSFD